MSKVFSNNNKKIIQALDNQRIKLNNNLNLEAFKTFPQNYKTQIRNK